MMTYDILPVNNYSCLFCQDVFQSEDILLEWWFCSLSHEYRYAFAYSRNKFQDKTKKELFKITKKIVRAMS